MQQKTLGSCTANRALIDGILNIVNLSLKNCLGHRGTPRFSSTTGILAHLLLLSGAVIEILVIISRERLLFCCKKRKKTKYTEDGQLVICEHCQFTESTSPPPVSYNEKMIWTYPAGSTVIRCHPLGASRGWLLPSVGCRSPRSPDVSRGF